MMRNLIFTIMGLIGISMPSARETFYVEVPGGRYIFVVKANDRADAMSKIGATAWTEAEFIESAIAYDEHIKKNGIPFRVDLYDRRVVQPGPATLIIWEDFIESIRK